MSPDAQRIAIAEECGWKHGDHVTDPEVCLWFKDGDIRFYRLPDYLHDLNAMHSALMQQDKPFRFRFETIMDNYLAGIGKLWCELEASEFAEIFLQCKREGMWKD